MASFVAKAIRRPGVAKAPAEKPPAEKPTVAAPSRLNLAIAKMRGK